MRLGGPRGRYGVAKISKKGRVLRQSVGYLFWWREREATRISHSLERSPEAFPPSSGACNGIPLHTPLLGSNRHSNPAFERTCAHPGRVPRLLAHPALALALASALAVDTPSHLLSHGHRLSHRLLHRLLLASAASLSCISSRIGSRYAATGLRRSRGLSRIGLVPPRWRTQSTAHFSRSDHSRTTHASRQPLSAIQNPNNRTR